MAELTPEDAAFIAAMDAIEAEAVESLKGSLQRLRESAESFAGQVKDRIHGSRDQAEIRAAVAGSETEKVND